MCAPRLAWYAAAPNYPARTPEVNWTQPRPAVPVERNVGDVAKVVVSSVAAHTHSLSLSLRRRNDGKRTSFVRVGAGRATTTYRNALKQVACCKRRTQHVVFTFCRPRATNKNRFECVAEGGQQCASNMSWQHAVRNMFGSNLTAFKQGNGMFKTC